MLHEANGYIGPVFFISLMKGECYGAYHTIIRPVQRQAVQTHSEWNRGRMDGSERFVWYKHGSLDNFRLVLILTPIYWLKFHKVTDIPQLIGLTLSFVIIKLLDCSLEKISKRLRVILDWRLAGREEVLSSYTIQCRTAGTHRQKTLFLPTSTHLQQQSV